ncbi:hypothetical protein [Kitasatospora sp. NPDC087315]|uniref:hypothetical protein n=1 Tax=Kitasatospora sp. NPDC087315 TaxID=3364069 RepID=UPI00381D7C3F
MSLSVNVFVVDKDGRMDVVDVPVGSSDLAGFESWRTVFVRRISPDPFASLGGGKCLVAPVFDRPIAGFVRCRRLPAAGGRLSVGRR